MRLARRLRKASVGAPLQPSGVAMPSAEIAGWRILFSDDFNLGVGLGNFPADVAARWGAYDNAGFYKDTSQNGTYDAPRTVSISGGKMDLWLHTETFAAKAATAVAATDIVTVAAHGYKNRDRVKFSAMTGGAGLVAGTKYYCRDITTNTFKVTATMNGVALDITSDMTAGNVELVRHLASAPYPRILGLPGGAGANAQLYGRYEVMFRVPAAMALWKLAWLLWPLSDDWPADGEIDFPECGLNTGDTISAFMHRQEGVDANDQDTRSTAVAVVGSGWHHCITEWSENRCAFYLDGTLLGAVITSRVPNTPMWYILQSETSTNAATPPADATEGHIELDWIVVREKMPSGLIRQGGSFSLKSASTTTMSVTVPAGGHAIGNLVVVAATAQAGGPAVTSVTDTRGNTYTDLEASNLWVSKLTTGLLPGDTITATFAATTGFGAMDSAEFGFDAASVVEDVTGVSVFQTATTAPSAGPVTPPTARTLVLAVLRVMGPLEDVFTEDSDTAGGAGWASHRVGSTGAGTNVTVALAFKLAVTSAGQTYNPVLGTARDTKTVLTAVRS